MKKRIKYIIWFICLVNCSIVVGQKNILLEEFKEGKIKTINRQITIDSKIDSTALSVYKKGGAGFGMLENISFKKGTIEFDAVGENVRGGSFVGLAFNIQSDSVYEAVYFRPFNFLAKDKNRKKHMVQYIFHPEYPWFKLRKERTDEFENELETPPDPNYWFHVTLDITKKKVKVYVNNNSEPDLEVIRLAKQKSDKIGIWTGNGSRGGFKNLIIK